MSPPYSSVLPWVLGTSPSPVSPSQTNPPSNSPTGMSQHGRCHPSVPASSSPPSRCLITAPLSVLLLSDTPAMPQPRRVLAARHVPGRPSPSRRGIWYQPGSAPWGAGQSPAASLRALLLFCVKPRSGWLLFSFFQSHAPGPASYGVFLLCSFIALLHFLPFHSCQTPSPSFSHSLYIAFYS